MDAGLTPKQALFVREYRKDLNATQAAIRAGYSAKTAHVQGPRLLANVAVKQALGEQTEKLFRKVEITAEKVLEELAGIGFAELLAPSKDEETGLVSWPTIRASDKTKALELLGKHLKLFTDRLEVKADESFAELLRQARERAQRR